ncbi:MAG: VCBS repeat-containing protein [Thermoanaerobaculia bacterium]
MRIMLIAVVLSAVLPTHPALAQFDFDPAVSYTVGQDPSGVAVADFDGDLRPDLAVTSDVPDKVSILSNNGAGAFGAPVVVALGGGTAPHGVAAGDFDGDKDLDLAVVLKNVDSVQVLINTSGSFAAGAVSLVNGLLPRDVVVGDLDHNGLPDVVTSNRDSDNVSVLLNTAGALAGGVNYAAGLEPRGLALGHFNGDTFLDLAVAANDSRQVSVLLNDGDGTFGAPIALSLGPDLRPDGVVAADLDRDGDMDIAASSSGDTLNLATVFLRTGPGSFSAPISYPVAGLNPDGIVAADFDVDGLLDLATADQDSAQVSVLRNLGGAVYAAPVALAVGTTPGPLRASDLNGNGARDLVSANGTSGNVSVLINRISALLFGDGFESGDTSVWSSSLPTQ